MPPTDEAWMLVGSVVYVDYLTEDGGGGSGSGSGNGGDESGEPVEVELVFQHGDYKRLQKVGRINVPVIGP